MTDIDNKTEFANWRQYHIGVYGRTPSDAEECHDFPIWLAARASTPPSAAEPCAHRIADVRNKVVKSGYMCLDCGAVFAAADHDGPRASAAPAVQAVGEPVERTKLWPMQNDEDQEAGIVRQWYFDCAGHYIDVALDDGKYSIFFRDRATGKEGWLDQADEPTPAIQPPPSAKPAPADLRPVVGIVDERYLRPTNGGEG